MNEETPSENTSETPTQDPEQLSEFGEFFKKVCQQIHLSLNPDGEPKLGFSIVVFDTTSKNPVGQIWSNTQPDLVYKVLTPWMARMRQAFQKKERRVTHLKALK